MEKTREVNSTETYIVNEEIYIEFWKGITVITFKTRFLFSVRLAVLEIIKLKRANHPRWPSDIPSSKQVPEAGRQENKSITHIWNLPLRQPIDDVGRNGYERSLPHTDILWRKMQFFILPLTVKYVAVGICATLQYLASQRLCGVNFITDVTYLSCCTEIFKLWPASLSSWWRDCPSFAWIWNYETTLGVLTGL
jgi:hypothetical protein